MASHLEQWQPSTTLAAIRARANLLQDIRAFFAEKKTLEVETPLLAEHTVTDPFIQAVPATVWGKIHFLQTSPEYAMKRLLAAGSGPIFQICKAFRAGESGVHHNPEFTMLEWYQPGYDYHDLMCEVDELLNRLLNTSPGIKVSYADLFKQYCGICPHTATTEQLKEIVVQNITLADAVLLTLRREDYHHLLMTHVIEKQLIGPRPWIIYDFPVEQAALAKIRTTSLPVVAERFEVYLNGVELANGYHELTDAKEQAERFEKDNQIRKQLGYPAVKIDKKLLSALEAGMVTCSGVAMGLDRLLMLKLQAQTISEVISFPL